MSNNHTPNINISSQFFASLMMSYSIYKTWKPSSRNKLRTDPDAIKAASKDYGNLVQESPCAVLCPSSVHDIVDLIKLSNSCPTPFAVSARGRGHSVRGQAAARGGVVVDMASLGGGSNNGGGIRVSWSPSQGYYADVGGEQMWIDVLRAGLEHGLAPVSWTDYLHLTVGGTLSNAGISGQSFLYGPQITNVLQLDVITGKGDFLTCSKHMNSELFFAVLGGLGQFGIITRARIVLQKAPTRAKWVRLIYSDFSKFTRDQERLISNDTKHGPNYVEGSLITDHSPPNNWRSSFYSPSDLSKLYSLLQTSQGLLYSLEVVKYYDHHNADTIDQEMDMLVQDLKFIPGSVFKKDVALIDFLNRVGNSENHDKSEDELDAHPWLNLFIPKSRIMDFNAGVLVNIIRRNNKTSGPILFYPFHRQKWDDRMSAVIPDEEIFYTLGLLSSCRPSESEAFDKLNSEIIDFCEKTGIKIKQYLPSYNSKAEWKKHFGSKWDTFQERKLKFDPRMILSPGQRIFNSSIMESDI
ncbi:cytokinin dehydrogenase 3 [Phtheirospermum japonicum]|uniref:cytokinin dehydrogenase n=1 Tax=Phtheirospermum japonicum TaxID=374723 RepID=A0A830CD88_9LAMI|nr:cytokinin dehydrogenase 3 [Phtheirospermum japonicum]